MLFSIKDSEKLVRLAKGNGQITYEQINKTFPELSNDDLYDLIGTLFVYSPETGLDIRAHNDSFQKNALLLWINCPGDYHRGYQFKSSDTFSLAPHGEDILYEYEQHSDQMFYAKIAAAGGIISAAAIIYEFIKFLISRLIP